MYKSVQALTRRVQHRQLRFFNYQTELFRPGARFGPQEDQRLSEELKGVTQLRHTNAQLYNYIKAYHEYGVRLAKLNPLEAEDVKMPVELNPETYGLRTNSSYSTEGFLFNDQKTMSLTEIEQYLQSIYSSHMAIEFSFIDNEEEKLWIAREFEKLNGLQISNETRVDLLKLLVKSQVCWFIIRIKSIVIKYSIRCLITFWRPNSLLSRDTRLKVASHRWLSTTLSSLI